MTRRKQPEHFRLDGDPRKCGDPPDIGIGGSAADFSGLLTTRWAGANAEEAETSIARATVKRPQAKKADNDQGRTAMYWAAILAEYEAVSLGKEVKASFEKRINWRLGWTELYVVNGITMKRKPYIQHKALCRHVDKLCAEGLLPGSFRELKKAKQI